MKNNFDCLGELPKTPHFECDGGLGYPVENQIEIRVDNSGRIFTRSHPFGGDWVLVDRIKKSPDGIVIHYPNQTRITLAVTGKEGDKLLKNIDNLQQ